LQVGGLSLGTRGRVVVDDVHLLAHGPHVGGQRETGLTTDGVAYHLRRLSERWGAANRTELVARAYALGVLVPGAWPPAAGR
ncbi:hypothetical protein ACWDAZ_40545, partial [Streptomyces sp. NPDC001215]